MKGIPNFLPRTEAPSKDTLLSTIHQKLIKRKQQDMDDTNDSNNSGVKHMKISSETSEELSIISPPISAIITSTTASIEAAQQLKKNTTKKRKMSSDAQQATDDDVDNGNDNISDIAPTTANKSKKPTLLDDIRENKQKEKNLTDMICNAMSK